MEGSASHRFRKPAEPQEEWIRRMFVFLCCFAAFGMTVSRPIHVAGIEGMSTMRATNGEVWKGILDRAASKRLVEAVSVVGGC